MSDHRWSQVGYGDLLALVCFVAVLTVRIVQAPNPLSGNDPGNWLALSAELMGQDAKAAAVSYPPLFLLMVLLANLVFSPMEAVRIAAIAASLAPGLAAYCLFRALGLQTLSLIGFGFSFTGYASEMFAWGGFPQLLGTGCLIGALAAAVMASRTMLSLYVVVAGVLAGLAVLANPRPGLQAVAGTIVIYAMLSFLDRRQVRQIVVGLLVLSGTTAIVAAPASPYYLAYYSRSTYNPFNVTGAVQGFSDVATQLFRYVSGEAPVHWLIVFLALIPTLVMLLRRRDWQRLVPLLTLVLVSSGFTIITWETRFWYVMQLAGLVAVSLILKQALQNTPNWPKLKFAATVAVFQLLLSLLAAGLLRFQSSVNYYAVLDEQSVQGLEWLAHDKRPDDLAASAAIRNGWAFGWWVEGIAYIPTYSESDLHWLAFIDEQEHARIARAIFSHNDPRLATAEAQRHGVTLLVINSRDSARADLWLESERLPEEMALVYSNPSLVIFRIARSDRPG